MGATATLAVVPKEMDASGRFVRQPNAFRDRITEDGSSGFPSEPGRYHVYVARSRVLRRLRVELRGLLDE